MFGTAPPVCRRNSGLSHFDVPVVAGPGIALPSSLVMTPGVYNFAGYSFDCSSPGGYYFCQITSGTTGQAAYRIAATLPQDIGTFLSALSFKFVTGDFDQNGYTIAQNRNTLKGHRFVQAACERTSKVACEELAAVGLSCRVVRALTAQTPTYTDNGHVVVEVWIPNSPAVGDGRWEVVDFQAKERFGVSLKDGERPDGTFLMPQRTKIGDPRVAHTFVNPALQGYTFSAYEYVTHGCEAFQNEWTNRCMQIPGIDHTDGKTYYYVPPAYASRQAWVESLGLTVVSKAQWLAMFYP